MFMNERALFLLIPVLATGCAHVRTGEVWGEDATFSPGWAAVKRAAVEAAKDPYTWAPAIAAAAVQIGDADDDFADNVRRDRPIFGSADTADDVSNGLRWASLGIYVALGLGAPGPEDSADWWRAKGKGLLAGGAAIGATIGLTSAFKSITDRTRPNDRGDRSLPSGHASTTAAASRLAADALDYYDLNRGTRIAAHAGLVTLTATTSWARIEAGEHHPSDVLLGAALGNFVAKFTTHAFLHPALGEQAVMNLEPLPGGGVVVLSLAY
jgi:hypothetical protein